ncbi:MAG TPA: hypothetical protein VHE54_11915, partial [Puia sp.]|nr:hypothetical protein [Puia sp.]
FAKDLVLLVLIVFLFALRNRLQPALSPTASAAVLTLTIVFSVAFQWYVLIHLPMVDCLPYREKSDLIEGMKMPRGAVQDSSVITLVYEKNGRKVEFGASSFPADFDSTYHFVNRYDKLVRKGNAEPPIKDFNLFTGSGADTTLPVLTARGYKLFLFMKEFQTESPSWDKGFSVVLTLARAKNLPVFIITADYDDVAPWTTRQGIATYVTVLKCDATAIKTAARADPTLFLLKRSTVLNKWSYADLDAALPVLNQLPTQ